MINRQMSAVIGRPVQTNMSEVVRARSPMVYEKAAQQRQQANDDRAHEIEKENLALEEKNLALAERSQAHNERVARESLALQNEQFEDQKKRTRTGQVISVGTGLANLYFGNKEANAMEEAAASLPTGQKAGGNTSVVPGAASSAAEAASTATAAGTVGQPSGGKESGGLWPTIKDGFTEGLGNIMAGGGIGIMASQLGSSSGSKAAIGAGVGAASNWVMNGGLTKLMNGGGVSGSDMVGAAASGIIGGLGGLFL